MEQVVTGSIAGTGATINISLGFIPRYVKVFNYNDAGALYPTVEWWEGMPAASGLKNKRQAVNEGGTATYSVVNERITANGISEYAGSANASKGFTIGADTDINVSGETVYYLALR